VLGIYTNKANEAAVREFFELFKTPWEFGEKDKQYAAIIATSDQPYPLGEELTIVYNAGKAQKTDASAKIPVLNYEDSQIPIYRSLESYDSTASHLVAPSDGKSGIRIEKSNDRPKAVIPYNLFEEIRFLLVTGQPIEFAHIPTLDLHISILRDLLKEHKVSLEEIAPKPDGHPYTICLSHDVDHPKIRFHKFDHTILGFLARATLGSVLNLFRGRTSVSNCVRNLLAAISMPFAQLGLIKDTWASFDKYIEIEKELPSTFFTIPFKGDPGIAPNGQRKMKRASGYGAEDIKAELECLTAAAKEIAVHGINSWSDPNEGRRELAEIVKFRKSDEKENGIRMHWLYFDSNSFATLEDAGYTYDSTVGYNETIGYKAGTSQAFRPIGSNRLLELPLIIMDTSLFYPSHLGLTYDEAKEKVMSILQLAKKHGGVVTINWHDRSLAPERNWGPLYKWMIQQGRQDGAWFASMCQATAWFRERRKSTFGA
jgi:hypothetical protein